MNTPIEVNDLSVLDAALHYHSLGYSVIPVRVIPVAGGKMEKKPLIPWAPYQKRIATEKEIRGWFSQYTDAGVGIVTGKISNLLVVDVDKGAKEEDVGKLNLGSDYSVKTISGGRHFYFQLPQGFQIKNSAGKLGDHIDIRAEGGYVVAPPTNYGDSSYEVLNNIEYVTEPSAELIEALTKQQAREPIVERSYGESILEGRRNDSAASYIGRLLNKAPKKDWEKFAWPATQNWNRQYCAPPLSITELRGVFESIKQRETSSDQKAEPTKYPAIIRWGEFSRKVFIEKRWLIKDLIPAEGFVILAAPSGEKKSWIALEMMRCITAGIPFLGKEDFGTVQGNVLYIDQEMPAAELQRRGRQLGLKEEASGLWMITTESEGSLNLNTPTAAEWLLTNVKEKEIKVIFIDTLRAVAGGLDENKAEEIRKFFNLYKSLKNLGTTIVFLDHCRKPAHFEGKTPKKEQLFASQDKAASVEVVIMTRSEAGSNEIALYVVKNRIAAEHNPFRIVIKDEMDTTGNIVTTKLEYAEFVQEKETKEADARNLIVAFLKEGPKSAKEIKRMTLVERIGQKNTENALRALVEEGIIDYEAKRGGRIYSLKKAEDSDTQGELSL